MYVVLITSVVLITNVVLHTNVVDDANVVQQAKLERCPFLVVVVNVVLALIVWNAISCSLALLVRFRVVGLCASGS